jgi:hypothetical protein
MIAALRSGIRELRRATEIFGTKMRRALLGCGRNQPVVAETRRTVNSPILVVRATRPSQLGDDCSLAKADILQRRPKGQQCPKIGRPLATQPRTIPRFSPNGGFLQKLPFGSRQVAL